MRLVTKYANQALYKNLVPSRLPRSPAKPEKRAIHPINTNIQKSLIIKRLQGIDVPRTGIEPVRPLLATGFSCYSCFYTSRLHPEC